MEPIQTVIGLVDVQGKKCLYMATVEVGQIKHPVIINPQNTTTAKIEYIEILCSILKEASGCSKF